MESSSARKQILAKAFKRKSQDFTSLTTDKTPRLSPFVHCKRVFKPLERVTARSMTPMERTTRPLERAPLAVQESLKQAVEPIEDSGRVYKENPCLKKPLPFVILESYINEVCSELQHAHVSVKTLSRAGVMVKALDDCAKLMPDLSMHFYNLSRSILKDLFELSQTQSEDYSEISDKLIELSVFLTEKKYVSKEHPVSRYEMYLEKFNTKQTLREIEEGLNNRLSNISKKNISVVCNSIHEHHEVGIVVNAFLMLVQQVEPGVTSEMISSVPGKAVHAAHAAIEGIRLEQIPESVVRKIDELLDSVSYDALKNVEKSGTGIVLYEFLKYTVAFFDKFEKPSQEILNLEVEPPPKKNTNKTPIKKQPPADSYKKIEAEFRRFLIGKLKIDSKSAKKNKKAYLKEFQELHKVPGRQIEMLGEVSAYNNSTSIAMKMIKDISPKDPPRTAVPSRRRNK